MWTVKEPDMRAIEHGVRAQIISYVYVSLTSKVSGMYKITTAWLKDMQTPFN